MGAAYERKEDKYTELVAEMLGGQPSYAWLRLAAGALLEHQPSSCLGR